MSLAEVSPAERPLSGRVRVPGDKSISHRAAIVAALAPGRSRLTGFSGAGDCQATLSVLEALGVRVELGREAIVVQSTGTAGLRRANHPLDCRRSGTTMRLLAGMLAGAGVEATLTGDRQLLRRPMARVAQPLWLMGANIELAPGDVPPIRIHGRVRRSIEYTLPVASAQVKSAILLAALGVDGVTRVTEIEASRDHTERLLRHAGVPLEIVGGAYGQRTIIQVGVAQPAPFDLAIPGDLSSAAFLLAAAAIVPGSDLTVEAVGLNPTRTAFLDVLRQMGAIIDVELQADGPEPTGEIRARRPGDTQLSPVSIGAADVPGLIDELPLIGVLATQADGVTEIRGASELRVKESDRIASLTAGLRSLGADIEEFDDGFAIRGATPLAGGAVDPRGDHRLAMAFSVAALGAKDSLLVEGFERVADSFPGFLETLGGLR